MEIGWDRGAPSGTRPPRDAGIQEARQRRRSYTHDDAFFFRRSMASPPGGATPLRAMPSGAARHFCEPVMFRSTPHSSVRTSIPASDDTVSSRKSAPWPLTILPTAAAGYVVPVDVSLWTIVTSLGLTRATSFS